MSKRKKQIIQPISKNSHRASGVSLSESLFDGWKMPITPFGKRDVPLQHRVEIDLMGAVPYGTREIMVVLKYGRNVYKSVLMVKD